MHTGRIGVCCSLSMEVGDSAVCCLLAFSCRELVENKGVHKSGPEHNMDGTGAGSCGGGHAHCNSSPKINLQSTAAAVRRNDEDVYAVAGVSSCCFVEPGLQCFGGMAKLGCSRFIRFKSNVSELIQVMYLVDELACTAIPGTISPSHD